MLEKKITMTFYTKFVGGELTSQSFEYESNLEHDLDVAAQLCEAVEKHYAKAGDLSVPRHLLQSARELELPANPDIRSDIFVIPYSDIGKISAKELRAVHEDRHILIVDRPVTAEPKFDIQTLSSIGGLYQLRPGQGSVYITSYERMNPLLIEF